MNSTFIIQPAEVATEQAELFLEIRPRGLSYIIINNKECLALASYYFKSGTNDEAVTRHIHRVVAEQPVLQQTFKKVYIIYGYAQSVLVPQQFITALDNKAMLELVFGDAKESIVRTGEVENHNIRNVYSVPAVVDSVMKRYFEHAAYCHLFSLLPGIKEPADTFLYCIFSTGQVTVLVQKEGQLQLMQNYAYKIPDDVAYHLLNICKSFEISPRALTVYLSGMIDAESPLYSELYKYFDNLVFDSLPEAFQYPEDIYEYPAHYFSHLFAVATCV